MIERIHNGSFVRDAIAAEGISHSCFYDHMGDNSDYLDTLKKAQLYGPVNVAEAELFRRGVEGTLRPVFQGGRQVGTIREFSDTALIFYLKCNHLNKYAASIPNKAETPPPSPELLVAIKQANAVHERLAAAIGKRRSHQT